MATVILCFDETLGMNAFFCSFSQRSLVWRSDREYVIFYGFYSYDLKNKNKINK